MICCESPHEDDVGVDKNDDVDEKLEDVCLAIWLNWLFLDNNAFEEWVGIRFEALSCSAIAGTE